MLFEPARRPEKEKRLTRYKNHAQIGLSGHAGTVSAGKQAPLRS
jgi:hypothetical protein